MNDKLPFKILLVHGNESNNYDLLPHTEEGYNHTPTFIQYFKNHYLDDEELQQMNVSTNPNTISLALVSRGNIVILDTTSYRPDTIKKYGKSILFMFPKEITETQVETMNALMPLFEGVDEYTIWYDFVKNNGETSCRCLVRNDIGVITNYLEKYYGGKRK